MRTLLLLCLACIVGCLSVSIAAADDPYTVSGIVVDASAPSAVEAQTIAINQGRDKAWTKLYRRLTKAQDWPHQPQLDTTTSQRLVRSYQSSNERRSTTRFVASMTYVFNPEAVRRILRQADIAFADAQAHPILVIPLSPGYASHAPWTQVWNNPRFSQGAVPLVLPIGDAVDESALSGVKFGKVSWAEIEPVASRMHAKEAVLALVQPGPNQLIVKLMRVGPGNSPPIPDATAAVPPKTPQPKALSAAADAAASAIADAWKAHAAVDFGKRTRLVASVHVETLEAWSQTLQKLASISTVADVNVAAMDIGEAKVAISYVGTQEQLNDALGRAGLVLSSEEGQTWLKSSSTTGAVDQ
ncbi:MAG TPA: DUF2066 domain-containing protein [Rhizomicrobium sp.]|jgi:hypothetical protein